MMMKKELWSFLALMMFVLSFEGHELTVMSFNIRYDSGSDGPLNSWKQRRDSLCSYVRRVSPDVFGMQEVLKNQLDDVASRLSDWAYVGVGRDDGKSKGEFNPVFYRKSKYRLMDKGWFWLSKTPEKPSFGWDAACRRIAVWVVLADKETNEKLLFCNSHFDHMSVKARMESAKLCKTRLDSIRGNMPVVFTADFNTNDKELTYSLLLDYAFPMLDVWKKADLSVGGPASFNDWGRRMNNDLSKIDFIFVSEEVRIDRAEIHDSKMGDGRFLSDHNAHWAHIII